MVHIDLATVLKFLPWPEFFSAFPFQVSEGQVRVLFEIPDHGLAGQKYRAFLQGLFPLGKIWVFLAIFV